MNETLKKIPFGGEICVLCKKSIPVAKEKINVFGKSGLNIFSLVKHATNVDLSVYVGCEKLAICRTKCYNRLVRLKNALNKVDKITREIQNDFDGIVPLRFKRLSKDSSGTPDNNFMFQSRRTAKQSRCKVVVHPIPVSSPDLSPILFGVINPSGILAYGFLWIH